MKTIAIIGGGFCGAECAKTLERRLPKDYRILLFDKKDYFEYTPSIHKLLTDVSYERKIKVPYSRFLRNTTIIKENISQITKDKIITQSNEYQFEYMVLATGSLTHSQNNFVYTLKTIEDAKKLYFALKNAKKILIVGGGYTGTELAGELASKTNKEIILINNSAMLLKRQPEMAGRIAFRYLSKKRVKIILNDSVKEVKNNAVSTTTDNLIKGDCIIWCVGIKPNTSFLNGFPLTECGNVKTELTLKVIGFQKIFAGGDITDIREEKSAQNAEYHGRIIARNILNSINSRELISYKSKVRIMVISLGDWNSIFTYCNLTFSGIIPAMLKKIIELGIVWRYRFF